MAQIRRVDGSEWEDVREVRLAALRDAPRAFSSTLEREVALTEDEWVSRITTSAWFVARDGTEAIGLVAGMQPRSGDARVREVVSMWVHPRHRGTNLASALIEAVRSWAVSDGASELRLAVTDGNDRARRFYTRLGFAPTGTWESVPDNPRLRLEELSLTFDASPRTA